MSGQLLQFGNIILEQEEFDILKAKSLKLAIENRMGASDEGTTLTLQLSGMVARLKKKIDDCDPAPGINSVDAAECLGAFQLVLGAVYSS